METQSKLAPSDVRVPSAVETLALLYTDLRRQAKAKRKRAVKPVQQPTLL